MNLDKKNLSCIFLISFLFVLVFPVIAPQVRIAFFVPFLIILFYQKAFAYCLWFSFFCGLTVDLLSVQSPFGFYAFTTTLTSMLIYHQKRNFFADHLSTLPMMTFFFSFTATLLELIFQYILGFSITLNGYWILSDLLILPASDALYAFLCFILIPGSLKKKKTIRNY